MADTGDALVWSQMKFASVDPKDMALAQAATLVEDPEHGTVLSVPYMHGTIDVSYPDGELVASTLVPGPTRSDHILVVQYLSGLGALPPREPWMSFVELPGGPHHHDLFCEEGSNPLAVRFGDDIPGFLESGQQLGGTVVDYGDAAVMIPAFPKVHLLVTLHRGRGEWPARANILFDRNATHHLATASLFVLGLELSRRLRGEVRDDEVVNSGGSCARGSGEG